MLFITSQAFLRFMNRRFRIALRVGTSYMGSLYCSWPFGVLEFSPVSLIFNGLFVGRLVVQRGSIIDICLHRSLFSKFIRIRCRLDGKILIVDVFSFRLSKLIADIDRWRAFPASAIGSNSSPTRGLC